MVEVIKNLEFEYKAAVIMGFGAFVISILIGIVSGVSLGTLSIRSLIIIPVFAGMGFGASIVIKKFVPELYEILNLDKDDSVPDVGLKDNNSEFAEKPSEEPANAYEDQENKSTESAFQEFSKTDFPKVDEPVKHGEDNYLESGIETGQASGEKTGKNSGRGALGKHIVMSESFGKYEPKIMAQAIRTMLKQEGD